MRSFPEVLLKIVVMAATMCSGIVVAKHGTPVKDEGHEGERGMRQDQRGLDRAA